jgi:hypothetical protein
MKNGSRIALVVAVCGAAVAASAQAAGAGTIVVRLVTDPIPPGVSWTYRGLGSVFRLGVAASQRSIADLPAGSYRIVETPTSSRPATLTSLRCLGPAGSSHTSVATATADLTLTAGETIVCTFTHRALGPRPLAAALALAQQFAPTLRLSAAEHFRPIAIEDYLSRATLKAGTPPSGRTTQLHPTLFSLPTGPAPSYLDLRGAQPAGGTSQYSAIEQQLEQQRPRPTVYWRIAHEPSTGRIAIEYWFLYLYNDFVDRHEADWEGVTVVLQNSAPLGISYSQHQGRSWAAWSVAPPDDHAVVYVAAGSHANYPLPGRYRVKVCWTLSVRRCTTTPERDDARGDGTTLNPSDYELQSLGGTGYSGNWSSGTYVVGIGLTKDRVSDPRLRRDFTNPFAAVPPGA